MKNIIIFHYHFLPGGVTTVIKNQIHFLKQFFPDINFILISSDDKKDSMPDNYKKLYFPEFDYIENISLDKKSLEQKIEKILYEIHKQYKNSIWWIHNHHLGKNPIFTHILSKFLESTEQKAILQIHDFPECARLENYQTLLNFYPDIKLYPLGKNIIYSVINKNDYEILRSSGIPENKLVYLPNIYIKKEIKYNAIQYDLEKLSYQNGFHFNKNLPIVLYPVRSIRRKNILEAILFNKVLQNFNLIVTLPANSKSEINYSNLVKTIFLKEKVIGAWGIAAQDNNIFDFILKNSKLIISTSILEGFGLFIFDALSAKKNFYARELPIFKDFNIKNKKIFYNNLYVKIDGNNLDKIKNMYIAQLKNYDFLKKFENKLMEEIEQNFIGKYIDYSYLDIENQYNIIKNINKKEIDEIKSINPIFNDFGNMLKEKKFLDLKIDYQIGNKAIINLFTNIDNYFNHNIKTTVQNIEKNVLEKNLNLKNLKLLFNKY